MYLQQFTTNLLLALTVLVTSQDMHQSIYKCNLQKPVTGPLAMLSNLNQKKVKQKNKKLI